MTGFAAHYPQEEFPVVVPEMNFKGTQQWKTAEGKTKTLLFASTNPLRWITYRFGA